MQTSLRHAHERADQLQRQVHAITADRDSLVAAVATLETALADAKQHAADARADDASGHAIAKRAQSELDVTRRRVTALECEKGEMQRDRVDMQSTLQDVKERERRSSEELQKAGKAMLMAQARSSSASAGRWSCLSTCARKRWDTRDRCCCADSCRFTHFLASGMCARRL